ncbi:MAG: nucleotide exchange factor GrpE [Synergistaceae bacterium]|nr:nucleotide exchange factor GrpE [Synergistaceae bacterium]MBQ3399640.1 nucleotide exchange factor GrpE [Synergistaceae bacterium]
MDEEKLESEEELEPEITEDDSQSEAEKLKQEIESLKVEIKTVRADFYNFRQRTIKERQETRTRAREEVITAMLPVLDNLDRALSASSDDPAGIVKGVEMVQRQFMGVLEGLGVSVIKSEGENFDPSLHDASGTEKVDDPELDGKIITEQLKGYRTKERVLRPAKVTVGKI